MSFVIASCHGNCETVSVTEPISQKHDVKIKERKTAGKFPIPVDSYNKGLLLE